MYAWEDVHVCARQSPSSKGTAWGAQGFRPNSPPCPCNPGGPPVALRAGFRPAAARVPAGGTAAAAADRPAQPARPAPAAVPGPGPHCRGQSGGARPRGSGRGERRRKGRCVGMCRWGRGRLRDLPLKRAQNPENLVEACELQGLERFPDARDRSPCPASQRSYLRGARPGGSGSALGRPASRGARPAAPAALPVVRPSSKSLVALAAARGSARAAASRRRRSAGTPPSAPAWSPRPGPGYPGAEVRPPPLQVGATLTGRRA